MRFLFFSFVFILSFACQNNEYSKQVTVPVSIKEMATSEVDSIYFSKEELMGHFEPSMHADFVKIEKPYTQKSNMLLRRKTAKAFIKMYDAAKADGVELKIISSTRNFKYQKGIWERKWKKYAKSHPNAVERAKYILRYSSMPSTSRHHWGTDIDLNDLNNSSFEKGGKYEDVYTWLSKHAGSYGFCQPYTPKGALRTNGYNEERWHWSYMPLAEQMLKDYRQVEQEDIKGFLGAETAAEVEAIEHFVNGVACH